MTRVSVLELILCSLYPTVQRQEHAVTPSLSCARVKSDAWYCGHRYRDFSLPICSC